MLGRRRLIRYNWTSYNPVTVGGQGWMAVNFKVTHSYNGDITPTDLNGDKYCGKHCYQFFCEILSSIA